MPACADESPPPRAVGGAQDPSDTLGWPARPLRGLQDTKRSGVV